MKTLWVLEDNDGCLEIYRDILSDHYHVELMKDMAGLFQMTKDLHAPDLLISDIMLPDGKFINHLNDYRQIHPDTPIIIVSGLDDYSTIRHFFMNGVVDYLTKPFRPSELLVKVQRVMEQRNVSGSLSLGIDGKNVIVDGITMDNLTTKQIQILSLFLQTTDRRVQKDVLMKSVWGSTTVHPKALDVHIYHLRRKLEDYGLQIKSSGHGEWQLLSRYVAQNTK
ncbi:MAG: response regulator transcription factor [Bdellovibrio sp.]|nr:response regulator transcription factor [Bdellovibrio sp.]